MLNEAVIRVKCVLEAGIGKSIIWLQENQTKETKQVSMHCAHIMDGISELLGDVVH